MTKKTSFRFGVLVVINVLGWCVLTLQQATQAQVSSTNPDNLPFANSVTQRFDMVAQLKEINAELKAGNALLRSGQLKVVVVVEKK